MQVTETLAEGLKRELTITIPATDLSNKLDDKLSSLKSQVRLPGFRPGKVPVSHLKKVYGKQAMAEVINDTLNESTNAAIAERKEKPASEPKFTLPEDEKKAEDIIAGKEDLEIAVAYEIIPDFEVKDFSGIEIERPVVDVTDEMLDERMKQIASSNVTYKAVKRKAKNDDQVTFDFLGKVDGEAFDGGAEDTTEDKAKEEYRVLAERRVRLGLLLAEVGGQNNVQVTNEELQRAVIARAQQFQGQEREVIEFFQKNPQQLAGIRAPIFEDKVIDFILELAKVTDKSVDPADLDDEDEHDHDHHGHDHDHDHDHDH